MISTLTLSCLLFLIFQFESVDSIYANVVPLAINFTEDLKQTEFLFIFSSRSLILNSTMRSDCQDFLFKYEENNETIPYWLESGCNTDYTNVWLQMFNVSIGITYIKLFYNDVMYSYGEERKRFNFTGNFVLPNHNDICTSDSESHSGEDRLARIHDTFFEGDHVLGGKPTHCHKFDVTIYPNRTGNISYFDSQKPYSNPFWRRRFLMQQIGWYYVALERHTHHDQITFQTDSVDLFPPYYNMKFCVLNHPDNPLYLLQDNVFMSTDSDLVSKYPSSGFRKLHEIDGLFPRNGVPVGDSTYTSKINHEHTVLANSMTSGANKSDCEYLGYSISVYYGNRRWTKYGSSTGENKTFAPLAPHYHEIKGDFSNTVHMPQYKNITFYLVEQTEMETGPVPGTVVWVNKRDSPPGWEDITNDFHKKFIRGSVDNTNTGGAATHQHSSYGERTTKMVYVSSDHQFVYPYFFGDNHSESNHTHNIEFSPVYNQLNNKPSFINFAILRRKEGKLYDIVMKSDYMKSIEWDCFGKGKNDEEACSTVGYCFNNDLCICPANYYGEECQEHILPQGEYISNNKLQIPWEVDVTDVQEKSMDMNFEFGCSHVIQSMSNLDDDTYCTWVNSKLTRTSYLLIKKVPDNIEYLEIKPVTENGVRVLVSIKLFKEKKKTSNLGWIAAVAVAPFMLVGSQVLLICCFFFCMLCCCILVCLLVCPCFLCIFLRQREGIAKLNQIEDIDLLLLEQRLEKDYTSPKFQINKDLYEIEFSELKIQERISGGGGDSGDAQIYRCTWKGSDACFKCFKFRDVMVNQYKYEEFEREVSILASVSHPSVLRFFGAVLKEPRVGILMEYCHNSDVKQFLESFPENHKGALLEMGEKIRIIGEIAQGMEYIHSRNIIHRDLKNANILLNNLVEAKIMDFGLSRIVSSFNESKTRKIGTSYYMAPEIVRGEEYTEKCDVYSFGIMMFEIICNNFNPYGKNVSLSIEFKIANDPNFRPITPRSISTNNEVNWMIPLWRNCWFHDGKQRPSFEEISKVVKKKKEEEEGEENSNEDMIFNERVSIVEKKKNTDDEGLLKEEIEEFRENNSRLRDDVRGKKNVLDIWKEKVIELQTNIKKTKEIV